MYTWCCHLEMEPVCVYTCVCEIGMRKSKTNESGLMRQDSSTDKEEMKEERTEERATCIYVARWGILEGWRCVITQDNTAVQRND